MATKKESTAMAVQENNGFTALANSTFSAMVSEELDGLDLSIERIKIVNNANLFALPAENDGTTTVPEFSAVILHQHAINAYYKTAFKGGNAPPDCASHDGKNGLGDPGGKCATCRFNQYGSGENGLSKACKNRRRIYILREGECFPLMLSLPPASLKSFTKYLKFLLSKNRPSNSVVTRFSLKSAASGNMTYSQAVFSVDRSLTAEEYAAIQPYSEQMKAYAAQVGFDTDSAVLDEDMLIDPDTGEVIEPLGGRAKDV
jgi:hypothetical protein